MPKVGRSKRNRNWPERVYSFVMKPLVVACLSVLALSACQDGDRASVAADPVKPPSADNRASDAASLLSCPGRTTVTKADRLEAAPDTTVEDVLASWSAGEVRQRSARRALGLVELISAQAVSVGATTGVAELVRDPSGGWAANSLTTCLP